MTKDKSLQDIYGALDREQDLDSTLINRCQNLWLKALKDYNFADLRIMIGQGLGLSELIPMALTALEDNPCIDAELYKGDLLQVVFSVGNDFWKNHDDLNTRVVELKFEVESLIETLQTEILPLTEKIAF